MTFLQGLTYLKAWSLKPGQLAKAHKQPRKRLEDWKGTLALVT